MSVLLPLSSFATFAFFALTAAVHLIIAIGVHRDASERTYRKEPLFMFPPLCWAAIALLTGLLGLAFYWLAHHSKLSRD